MIDSTPRTAAPATDQPTQTSVIDALVLPPHYKVITTLSVPGATLSPRGLILIVGPNSSGKTQLLKDVHSVLTGQRRQLVVATNIQLAKPAKFEEFLGPLITDGYFKIEIDANGTEFVRQAMPFYGGGDFRGHNVNMNTARDWWNRWPASVAASSFDQVQFLDLVGHCLTTGLFLEKRIVLANQVGQLDYEANPPNNDLQALYMNEDAKSRLSEKTQNVFGKAVWIDNTRGNILCVRVNQSPFIPPDKERLEPQRMREYRQIESEGDGMRSYVGICIALLLGRKPICLIDEPELCLHPPQAHAMGRFIGSFGTSTDHATLTSTHSSHVLRGVIETTQDVQILRLSRVNGEFRGHLIGRDVLLDCFKRPIVRAETVLDGIFADGVAIVESDGDRAVYQTAWDALRTKDRSSGAGYLHRDILFIPVNGTGGISSIARFYRALHIPVTIIADLDFIIDRNKLQSTLSVLTDAETTRTIALACQNVADEIKKIPPTITESQVTQRLSIFAERPLQWANDDDRQLKTDLNGLTNDIDRMRRLKNGGIEVISEPSSNSRRARISC